MELSACIVVYNGAEEALRAAQTVLDCTRRYPLTLYLVDNASPDGSGKKLEQAVADGLLAAGPGQQVVVHCRTENGGFGTGHNTVLGVLDRGLEKLPSGPDLHEDYGCPEVTRGRTITTTDRSFTKLVLRDLELRNALLASPKDGLLILPGPGREGLHLVESYSYPDSMYTDWYSEPMNTGPDWTDTEEERAEKEEKLAELAQDTFFPRLEKVIGLTKAARGAALTWRMGTPG